MGESLVLSTIVVVLDRPCDGPGVLAWSWIEIWSPSTAEKRGMRCGYTQLQQHVYKPIKFHCLHPASLSTRRL